ncbi:MAG: hypothetical protein LBH16_03080 [Treponema sp.]|nr:hypothetical protein [Treponema sp.]
MNINKIRKPALFLFVFIIIFFNSGCVSVMEKTGRFIDGSAAAQKRVAVFQASQKDGAPLNMQVKIVRNKKSMPVKNEQSVVIALTDYPMMELRGSYPDKDAGFYLTSLVYLSGGINGWNEYTMDLTGDGALFFSGDSPNETAALKLNEDIEFVQITSGRIQRYDTRITGADALTGLRNRRERITAVTGWMSALDGAPSGQTVAAFEKHWKPLLFPEMVSKKKRPSGWLKEGDRFAKAEDIRWNTSYTDRVFPEEIKPVRDSGTLLRDWEEALSWIYLEYEWENIKKSLSREITLKKIK